MFGPRHEIHPRLDWNECGGRLQVRDCSANSTFLICFYCVPFFFLARVCARFTEMTCFCWATVNRACHLTTLRARKPMAQMMTIT